MKTQSVPIFNQNPGEWSVWYEGERKDQFKQWLSFWILCLEHRN